MEVLCKISKKLSENFLKNVGKFFKILEKMYVYSQIFRKKIEEIFEIFIEIRSKTCRDFEVMNF